MSHGFIVRVAFLLKERRNRDPLSHLARIQIRSVVKCSAEKLGVLRKGSFCMCEERVWSDEITASERKRPIKEASNRKEGKRRKAGNRRERRPALAKQHDERRMRG